MNEGKGVGHKPRGSLCYENLRTSKRAKKAVILLNRNKSSEKKGCRPKWAGRRKGLNVRDVDWRISGGGGGVREKEQAFGGLSEKAKFEAPRKDQKRAACVNLGKGTNEGPYQSLLKVNGKH